MLPNRVAHRVGPTPLAASPTDGQQTQIYMYACVKSRWKTPLQSVDLLLHEINWSNNCLFKNRILLKQSF